jgi:hypothetical protein
MKMLRIDDIDERRKEASGGSDIVILIKTWRLKLFRLPPFKAERKLHYKSIKRVSHRFNNKNHNSLIEFMSHQSTL